jgi:hypothetical protein
LSQINSFLLFLGVFSLNGLSTSERNKLEQYCRKWNIDFDEIDENKSFDTNMARLQKRALEKCRTPDVMEIIKLAKDAQKYLDNNYLARRESFLLHGPKQPKPTDTSDLCYSLKSGGLTGCGGFSLRNWTAKRLSAEHPKIKDGDGVSST